MAETKKTEFKSDEFKTRFTLPDTITVRQQLVFRGSAAFAGGAIYIRFWEAAKTIIDEWESEVIPNLDDFNIDTATDARAADVIQWVGTLISGHMTTLGIVPKNA